MTKTVIGTMSGTSLDAIDVAVMKTDGETIVEPIITFARSYSRSEQEILKNAIAACVGPESLSSEAVKEAEALVTSAHIEAIRKMAEKEEFDLQQADLIALHGQTLFHSPDQKVTIQIGNAEELARELEIDVVSDFRSQDVSAGGEGAPLVPIFHKAMLEKADISEMTAIVNIGGVANATIVKSDGLIAFDTGPGNALINDWITSRTSKTYDQWGRIAGEGRVNEILVAEWLQDPYFERQVPKSLDRNAFSLNAIDRASLADGAATLTAFSARAIARGLAAFDVKHLYVSGGGSHNRTMMKMLREASDLAPISVEEIGFNPDFVEAYAFAYLAARSEKGLPITFPGTTGVSAPISGGIRISPPA